MEEAEAFEGGRRGCPPVIAATVARPRHPPLMMRVFSRFSPKKVPLEDTTDSVVVEAEAAAWRATVAGGSGTAAGYEGVHGGGGRMRTMAAWHRHPHLTPPPAIAPHLFLRMLLEGLLSLSDRGGGAGGGGGGGGGGTNSGYNDNKELLFHCAAGLHHVTLF